MTRVLHRQTTVSTTFALYDENGNWTGDRTVYSAVPNLRPGEPPHPIYVREFSAAGFAKAFETIDAERAKLTEEINKPTETQEVE